MKKLMVIAAVVCATAITQAASVQWQVKGAGDYIGYNAYIYNGTSANIATVLSTVIPADEAPAGWTDKLSLVSNTEKSVNARGQIAVSTIAGVDNSQTWTIVLLDGAIAEGAKYVVMEDYAVSAYSFESGETPKTMLFENIKATGTLTVESVPEPTSGLLLLLGVAGLALRRRRA